MLLRRWPAEYMNSKTACSLCFHLWPSTYREPPKNVGVAEDGTAENRGVVQTLSIDIFVRENIQLDMEQ